MGEQAASSADRDGDLLRVALVGHLGAADVDLVSAALDSAGGRRFGVVLDRRQLGAPTAEGRAALECWAAEELPAHVPAIAAWADVLDERRYRSLTRDGEDGSHGPGYRRGLLPAGGARPHDRGGRDGEPDRGRVDVEVVSAVLHHLGPALAVLLFARIDVLGVARLRIATAALVRAVAPAVAAVAVVAAPRRVHAVAADGVGGRPRADEQRVALHQERVPSPRPAADEPQPRRPGDPSVGVDP